ncbi:MAG: SDR family NAD(P)-dependent oxidoreductase [Pseudomonadota bacterium]
MSEFVGKVCVVTGAASGIGRAISVELASMGAILAISDIDEVGLQETRRLLQMPETNSLMVDKLDVSQPDEILAYAERVKSALGSVDCIFNVAGLTRIGTFATSDVASFEKIMDVNFWGVVRLTKAMLPHLIESKGRIVNISSIFGIIGYEGQSHYCSSKFAVRGFSETIASELSVHGVSVTSVHPGGVDTNIVRLAEVDTLPSGVSSKSDVENRFKNAAKTSPKKAAEIILHGAAKRRRRVLVGGDARIVSLVQRLFPERYNAILSRLFARVT